MSILPNSQFGDLAVVDLGSISTSGAKVPVGAYEGVNDSGDFRQMKTASQSSNPPSGSPQTTTIFPRMSSPTVVRENANLWAVLGESPDLNLK